MRLLIATLALMSPAPKPAPQIDLERLVECICQIEGGHWGKPGGRGCIHYAAWSQHSKLPFQASMLHDLAWPVYLKHAQWIIDNLPDERIKVTPAAVYTCWHHGLEGGSRMILRHGLPEDAVRCMNLYESPAP